MLKKILPALALAALSLLTAPAALAQNPAGWRPCASAELQEQYFAQHPEARREYQRILQLAEESMQVQRRGGLSTTMIDPGDTLTNAVVPVVVHVLYYGIPANNTVAPTNITDRQINDAMAILNRDFSRKNPDTTDIIPFFKSRIANPGIKFRLAKRDPNGNCTTGITRHYTPETGYGTANVTTLTNWPTNKYLNLWIVDDIASGAGGYTFGGALGCPANDGIVLRRSQFGPNTGCTANLCTRSLTHEVGHYFGLPHTWGGTNTPGVASNCGPGVDDGIADTPNTAGVTGGGCPTTMPGCTPGTLANVQNYMDYADCEKMFTTGQKAVMRAALINSSCRRNMISAANLVATGTNDGYVAVPCAPIVFFNPTKTTVCTGGTVQFRDYSYNVNSSSGGVTYAWSFPGGTPATATTVAPTVTYATAGVYDVTLTVTSRMGGPASYTSTQLIRVNGPGSAEYAPLIESFEDSNAPFNYIGADLQRNYATSFTSPTSYSLTAGWQRRSTPGSIPAADGNAYLQVPNLQYPAGSAAVLTTPNINLAYITNPVLSFSEYFEPRYSGSNLNLRVQFSNDCGLNWNQVATYTASQLSQVGSTGPVPSAPSDWRTMTLPIPSQYHGSGTFQARFTLTNSTAAVGGQDNNFFFDKLIVTGPLGTHAAALAQRNISVYPNPLTNETAVHITLPASTAVQVSLTDVLGREVLALPAKTYPAGEQAISLASATNGLPAGVYVVRINLDGQTYTSKLAVQ